MTKKNDDQKKLKNKKQEKKELETTLRVENDKYPIEACATRYYPLRPTGKTSHINKPTIKLMSAK